MRAGRILKEGGSLVTFLAKQESNAAGRHPAPSLSNSLIQIGTGAAGASPRPTISYDKQLDKLEFSGFCILQRALFIGKAGGYHCAAGHAS